MKLKGQLEFHLQVFDLYGVSLRQAFPIPNLLKDLNFKVSTQKVPFSYMVCYICLMINLKWVFLRHVGSAFHKNENG